MSIVLTALTLVAAFAVGDRSGRTFARHYQDRFELFAALAVGASVLGALALFERMPGAVWTRAGLALATSAGLWAGYRRTAPLR